jgi:hypothetical protein
MPTLLENRLTIPALFPDTGGAWCVHIKLACWRAVCGKFKNIFIGKMGQFPLNYVTASQEKPVEWLTYLSSNFG